MDFGKKQGQLLLATGQSLSEMAMIMALVAVVGIVGLSSMSSGMLEGLKHLENGIRSQGSATSANSSVVGVTSPSMAQSSKMTAAQMPEGEYSLQLSSGQYLDLGSYPVDLSQQIETTGANGTTDLLLATMDSLIQQSLESGAITPEEANALKGLSQQGHRIADIQKSVETQVEAGAYLDNYGKSALRKEVEKIAYLGQAYEGGHPSKEGSEIVQFRGLLSQIQADGHLNDPALRQSISTLVDQIVNISNGVEYATYYTAGNSGSKISSAEFNKMVTQGLSERDRELGINTQQSILDLGASVVTHKKASEICNAGNSGVEQNCKSATVVNN